MADIERCKVCGFVSFHIQMSSHFGYKHKGLDYYQNSEVLGNTDADLKRYGFRPSIDYYRAKLEGKEVSVWEFERRKNPYA